MYHYRFIEHTADIAVEVTADTLEDLFTASALSFKESVIESNPAGKSKSSKLVMNSDTPEILLVNFLNELNFRLVSGKKIFDNILDFKIEKTDSEWTLECVLNEIDIEDDKIKTEIKSVTYHQMDIIRDSDKYFTRIIYDI